MTPEEPHVHASRRRSWDPPRLHELELDRTSKRLSTGEYTIPSEVPRSYGPS